MDVESRSFSWKGLGKTDFLNGHPIRKLASNNDREASGLDFTKCEG